MRFQAKSSKLKVLYKPGSRAVINNVLVVEPPEFIKFNNHFFITEDKDKIDYLISYKKRNRAANYWAINEADLEKARKMAKEIAEIQAKYNVDDNVQQIVDDEDTKPNSNVRGTTTSVKTMAPKNEVKEPAKKEAKKEPKEEPKVEEESKKDNADK